MEAGAHYPAKLELIIMFHGALQKFRARNERQERGREDESSLERTPRSLSLSLSLSPSLSSAASTLFDGASSRGCPRKRDLRNKSRGEARRLLSTVELIRLLMRVIR